MATLFPYLVSSILTMIFLAGPKTDYERFVYLVTKFITFILLMDVYLFIKFYKLNKLKLERENDKLEKGSENNKS
jgi:hypothetical protein